jgi:SAM-dependent methyltransferase
LACHHVAVLFQDRNRAESFGADAERYDRARPTYPDGLLDLALEGLGRDGPVEVLDVGCGTGIASRLFAERGCRVLGVEPDARMAAVARERGLEVEEATFEAWDPGSRAFDAVISGQAWHWVDPVEGAERAASVLRPGGHVALFWNLGRPPESVAEAFKEVYSRHTGDLDRYSVLLGGPGTDRFEYALKGLGVTGRFTKPVKRSIRWSRPYTTREWLDQLPTHSDHQALPPERLELLMDGIGAVIDSLGGSFMMAYETALISATRLPVSRRA